MYLDISGLLVHCCCGTWLHCVTAFCLITTYNTEKVLLSTPDPLPSQTRLHYFKELSPDSRLESESHGKWGVKLFEFQREDPLDRAPHLPHVLGSVSSHRLLWKCLLFSASESRICGSGSFIQHVHPDCSMYFHTFKL